MPPLPSDGSLPDDAAHPDASADPSLAARDRLLAGLERFSPDAPSGPGRPTGSTTRDADPTLVAVDATDRLLLDEAASALASTGPGEVVVIDDRFGALTLGAAVAHGLVGLRVHQDAVTGEIALDRNAREAARRAFQGLDATFTHLPLGEDLLRGARVVLLQLPRSLAALRDVAEHVARFAAPDVVLLAGGRIKHMTTAMNDVLAESFTDVRASLARQKSRVLVARGPRPGTDLTYPVTEHLAELDLDVVAYGAAFAGASLDLGTRFLLGFLDKVSPGARDAVDLGCGTGILAVSFARARPGAVVVATDQSEAAVRSAQATAVAAGVGDRVRVVRDDVGSSLADRSADVVLCNPPFHQGAALSTDAAHRMFAAAGRVLRPGGELWTVYNSHLRYRPALERAVGPTTQEGRDPRFTVTRSVAR
ncbi:class I SAM-dependent methyltransferase [Oerskovia sp. KBS0722]|uniref:class I SAM-dependent methyltransferase n=1 Tax=Oerskovia sp. KBS0722 TaxID=1179673 RepID=UPI001FEE027E|nr:methyltransferase [Oerskovia sp. KBS0722]